MVSKRCNRKTRKNNRKSRRSRSRKNLYGGSAPVNDTSMLGPQKLSLAQGNQFADLTKNMHGGMGTYPGTVTDSVLPQGLHASARITSLDRAYSEISGLKDQAGGRKRRNKSRKSRKNNYRKNNNRKSRKSRKNNYRGGALGYADVTSPGMLLNAEQTARAGLNPEWKLAENPDSFAPKA